MRIIFIGCVLGLLVWSVGCGDDEYSDSDGLSNSATGETTGGTAGAGAPEQDAGSGDAALTDSGLLDTAGDEFPDTTEVEETGVGDTGTADTHEDTSWIDCGGSPVDASVDASGCGLEDTWGDEVDAPDAPDVPDVPDASEDGLCAEAGSSTQQVSITVTNSGDSPRYLLLSGTACDAIEVRPVGGERLPLQVSLCGCECPAPAPPGAEQFARLEPGESHTISWDARALSTCQRVTQCEEEWTITEPDGRPQPVEPGEYAVTFGVSDALPSHCSEEGDQVLCDPWSSGGFGNYGYQEMCPDVERVEVTLTLPEDGDVTVSVNAP